MAGRPSGPSGSRTWSLVGVDWLDTIVSMCRGLNVGRALVEDKCCSTHQDIKVSFAKIARC